MSDALAALKARQGAGARYDAPNAPADDLLLARRGTAYFARKLNELSDSELDTRDRRRIIATVSYDARALAVMMAGARTGHWPEEPRFETSAKEIALCANLPARALRHLFHHTEVHLNVEWRDLPEAAWDCAMPIGGTPRSTPALRAKTVWFAALDLGNGGRLNDLPAAMRQLRA